MNVNGVARSEPDVTPEDAELSAALEAYLEAREAGRPIDAQQLVAEHPRVAERLRACLASLEAVEGVAGRFFAGDGNEAAPRELGCLGDYRLIREVGRGGMGVVYEAEQISLRRRVALKVLPFAATMDPRQLQRFHNEARAAASLQHEHIVPVYAVGCERGVHYYAMQFIDGLTLAQVIARDNAANEGTTDRIAGAADTTMRPAATQAPRDAAYFRRVAQWGIQAAEALEHAHSVGIVHRDIKPGNLMIDGAGKLWVTDFGLARTAADNNLTMTGDMLGTLRYMSPEQALARHGLVDHRSDVYALGVTLYELLTGRPAVEGNDRAEILDGISATDPILPCRHERAIPGDLQTVILKALSKDPTDRYGTASDLAQDLRRFLEDRAIQARPLSPRKRLARLLRRHRAVALAASVGLLACLAVLVLGAGVSIWQAFRAAAAQKQAESDALNASRQRDRAEGNMQLALQVLHETYRDMNGKWSVGDTRSEPWRRELLERMLAFHQRFLAQNSDNPRVLFEMARASGEIGDTYRELGDLPKAKQAVDQAIRLLNQLLSDDSENPTYRQALGREYVSLGRLLATMGQRQEGEETYRESIAIKKALAAEYPDKAIYRQQLSISHAHLGLHLMEESRWDEAEQQFRAVVDLDEAPGWDYLGLLYTRKGHLRDAEKAYRRVAESRRKQAAEFPLTPNYQLALASALNELAIAQEMVGDGQQAEGTWRENESVLKKLLAESPTKPQYRQRLAQNYYNYASLLKSSRKRQQAEEAYGQALDLQEPLADEFPRNSEYQSGLGATLNNLALLLKDRGELDQACRLLKKAVQHQQTALKANPRNSRYREYLGNHYLSLSRVLLGLKDHAGAAATAAELPVVSPERWLPYYLAADLLDGCASLARIDVGQTEQQRKEIADSYTRRARERRREAAKRNPDDPQVQNGLAWFLATCPEPEFIDPRRAVALATQAVQREPKNGGYWITLGVAQCQAGDWAAAVRALSKAEELLKEMPIHGVFFLAKAYWHLGKQRLARQYYDAACQYMEANKETSEELRRFRAEAAVVLGIKEKGKPKKD